jgi:ABC-type multidrug transport system fused ATPase/permease subunit
MYTKVFGHPLTPSVAFPAIFLLTLVRRAFDWFSKRIQQLVRGKVCLDRIAKFLDGDEIEPLTDRALPPSSLSIDVTQSDPMGLVGFENATFMWPVDDASATKAAEDTEGVTAASSDGAAMVHRGFVLKDVNVRFPAGKLSLVTGPTGSGKTSMLLALLGGSDPSTTLLMTAPCHAMLQR